jgi:hypothetical protein
VSDHKDQQEQQGQASKLIIKTTTDNEEFPRIFEERKDSCAIRVSIIRTK